MNGSWLPSLVYREYLAEAYNLKELVNSQGLLLTFIYSGWLLFDFLLYIMTHIRLPIE